MHEWVFQKAEIARAASFWWRGKMDQSSSGFEKVWNCLKRATGHLSPPTANIRGWKSRCFVCKPPCRVLVCPSVNCKNSTYLSSLQSWKSFTFMLWSSCRPRRPKCWVSSHHIVFTNASGVAFPNLLSFYNTSSSSFVKFLAVFVHLPLPAFRSNFAFPSKTCFDEWNSRCFTIDNGYCLSFKCLSRAAIMTLRLSS